MGIEVSKVQISEIWSISAQRIRAFFLSQNDVRELEEDRFLYGSCAISLVPLPQRQLGRFSFTQTRVTFDGPESETAAIHRRFVLQFISAGG